MTCECVELYKKYGSESVMCEECVQKWEDFCFLSKYFDGVEK